MIEDPMVPINAAALKKLVFEKTPFSMGQFSKLIGWSFEHNDEAPASKRAMAWKTLSLSRPQMAILYKCREHFPSMAMNNVADLEKVLDNSEK